MLPAWTELGGEEMEGRGGALGSGPRSTYELTFNGSACVSGPNRGVVGGGPAPGTVLGCMGTGSKGV